MLVKAGDIRLACGSAAAQCGEACLTVEPSLNLEATPLWARHSLEIKYERLTEPQNLLTIASTKSAVLESARFAWQELFHSQQHAFVPMINQRTSSLKASSHISSVNDQRGSAGQGVMQFEHLPLVQE